MDNGPISLNQLQRPPWSLDLPLTASWPPHRPPVGPLFLVLSCPQFALPESGHSIAASEAEVVPSEAMPCLIMRYL